MDFDINSNVCLSVCVCVKRLGCMKMEFLLPSSHHSCGQLGPVLVFASKEKEREGGREAGKCCQISWLDV